MRPLRCVLALFFGASTLAFAAPDAAVIDAAARAALQKTGGKGLAIAVIEDGEVRYQRTFGVRNAAGEPLREDTIMYGASLTKAVSSYALLRHVERQKFDLDAPLARLWGGTGVPEGDTFSELARDPQWPRVTARHVLTHSTGFANFSFVEPDRKLRIHFPSGSRYGYSGEGFNILQRAVENWDKAQGRAGDFGALVAEYVFTPLGMTRTSLKWRADFAGNLADGWNDRGEPVPHDERSSVRAAGSMDTTIADMARFAAAVARGTGLSPASKSEFVRPRLPIRTANQFPTLQPELPAGRERPDLHAGLGVVVFDGPQGRGWYKGGHNETTANTIVWLDRGQRALVLLSNDVRTEAAFAELVKTILGECAFPAEWEYGTQAGKS